MRLAAVILVLCSSSVWAQNVTKIVELRSTDTRQIEHFLSMFGVEVRLEPNKRFAALRGSAESIAAAEEALKRIQIPSRNIELVFQAMLGTAEPGGSKMPAELDPVVKQLRAAFQYGNYQLLDTLVVRAREGTGGFVKGELAAGGDTGRLDIHFGSATITSDARGNTIRLDDLKIYGYVAEPLKLGPDGKPRSVTHEIRMESNIDMREGQKAVVGKANLQGKEGSALFMVVTARIVD